MENGIYRNEAGAELEVTGFALTFGRYKTLGDTYEAVAKDSLFGNTWYIVTEKSMQECGYEKVKTTDA